MQLRIANELRKQVDDTRALQLIACRVMSDCKHNRLKMVKVSFVNRDKGVTFKSKLITQLSIFISFFFSLVRLKQVNINLFTGCCIMLLVFVRKTNTIKIKHLSNGKCWEFQLTPPRFGDYF